MLFLEAPLPCHLKQAHTICIAAGGEPLGGVKKKKTGGKQKEAPDDEQPTDASNPKKLSAKADPKAINPLSGMLLLLMLHFEPGLLCSPGCAPVHHFAAGKTYEEEFEFETQVSYFR